MIHIFPKKCGRLIVAIVPVVKTQMLLVTDQRASNEIVIERWRGESEKSERAVRDNDRKLLKN